MTKVIVTNIREDKKTVERLGYFFQHNEPMEIEILGRNIPVLVACRFLKVEVLPKKAKKVKKD